MTNGDVIRAMSDEELAIFLTRERYKMLEPLLQKGKGIIGIEPQVVCTIIWRWLQMPGEA